MTPNPVDAAPIAERDEVIVVTAEELEVVRPDPDTTLDETEDALQLLSEADGSGRTRRAETSGETPTQMLSVADATLDARDETEDATQMLRPTTSRRTSSRPLTSSRSSRQPTCSRSRTRALHERAAS